MNCPIVLDSKYLKIGTWPASQKLLTYMGNKFTLEISKFSLALQHQALVNTSGRVLCSSPGLKLSDHA